MKINLARKLMAVFFTLCMVVSLMPISVFASEEIVSEIIVEKVKFEYSPGDNPQGTAQVTADDQDKYEIVYECWEQVGENGQSVAAWHSVEGSYDSLPTFTTFESGKSYVYSIRVKPKEGYCFNSKTNVMVNSKYVEDGEVVCKGDGQMYATKVKTINLSKDNAITTIDVEGVELDYQPNSTPKATAKRTGTNQDKYDILYECWEKQEKVDSNLTTTAYWCTDDNYYQSDGPAKFDTFEKGGIYKYSLYLKAKDGYVFGSDLKEENVTLNGKSLPFYSFVNVLEDGKNCRITYGTSMRPGQALEEIHLDGATIKFKVGDKPSFTGNVTSPYVDIDHERWDVDDKSGYGITSSDYWNTRYEGKLLTSFESGKNYVYGVYFKISDSGMEEGYHFDKNTKLYINDQEIPLESDQINLDDDGETMWIYNVLNMTPETSDTTSDYEIIEGANGVWTQNSDGSITFRINGDLSKFVGIKVDDEWVDSDNYILASGSTIVTLKNEYLQTLSADEHKITFIYTDGEVSTNFEVKKAEEIYEDSENPQTGDNNNISLWVSLFSISTLAIFGLTVCNMSKKRMI